MRTVARQYTFWLAGYYDDFIGARAVPDDMNTVDAAWKSSKTHHGNPINGWALLNPRYAYAWCERGVATGSARFNGSTIATADQHEHNGGSHEWLGYDAIRRGAGKYEGIAQLQFPDSLTNANRQKFDEGTGVIGTAYDSSDAVEGWLLFCNGYNTSGRYYAPTGTNDSTFGRSGADSPVRVSSGTTLHADAGIPGDANTPTTAIRTHLAGAYAGEITDSSNIATHPYELVYPIQSPAGKPFLVTETYHNSASYTPILVYDGTLNSKGDGDTFTMRICTFAVDNSTMKFKVKIGCDGTAMTSSASGDSTYTHAAIEYEITPSAYVTKSGGGTYSEPASPWDDYDFVLNYTAGTYDVVKNGTTVSTGNSMGTNAAGAAFTAATMYGWAVEAKNSSKKSTLLVDRVGLIRPLNDNPKGTTMPAAHKMTYSSAVNASSSMTVGLVDDDNTLKLLALFSGSAYSEWSLMMFRDNIDRPIWRGGLTGMTYQQNAADRTPTINLTAEDYSRWLENQLPTWEATGGGDPDSTEASAYDRAESQGHLELYYFGASRLQEANATLGFNEAVDGSGNFFEHLDSRMRNRSAHPIQLYMNEDDDGPDDAENNWEAAITAGHATSAAQHRVLHARWMRDLKESDWFKHTFARIGKDPQVTATLGSTFTVGDTSLTVAGPAPGLLSGGSIEFVDSLGNVDSGVISSATIANTTNGPWKVVFITKKGGTGTNRQFYANVRFTGSIAGSARNVPAKGDKVVFDGFSGSFEFLNREYTMGTRGSSDLPLTSLHSSLGGTGTTYEYGLYVDGQRVVYASDPTGTFTSASNTGVVKYHSQGTTGATAHWGDTTCTLPATNFFKRNHESGETINVRSLSDDFKHVWILWSDMRNNGEADADAGFRKKEFGLIAPYSSNYSVSIGYAEDDIGNDSERTQFVDLSIGDEVDLWELDATTDPITGAAWSTGNSDAESSAIYHDWASKAGSFVLFDTSRFFNLNTYTNGGKTGQVSGGNREVGDFLVETEGFPVLIDNYWTKAPTMPNNLLDPSGFATNYTKLDNRVTRLHTHISVGNNYIQTKENIFGDYLGTADLRVGMIRAEEQNAVFHLAYSQRIPAISNVDYYVDAAANELTMYVTSSSHTLEERNYMQYFYGVGMEITISGATTSSLNGTYRITGSTEVEFGVGSGEYGFTIVDDSFTTGVTKGAGEDADIVPTFFAHRLYFCGDLGQDVPGTSAPGEWDGTGYGGTNSADALVTALAGVSLATKPGATVPITATSYPNALVYEGLSGIWPMRMLMTLNGFIRNPASMTFNESDKVRAAYIDAITDNWLTQSTVFGLPGINSVPVSGNMNVGLKGRVSGGGEANNGGDIASCVILSNVATIDCAPTPHGLATGDVVELIELSSLAKTAADKNRKTYTVTVTTPTAFTVPATGIANATHLNEGFWRPRGQVDTFGSLSDMRGSSFLDILMSSSKTAGIGETFGTRAAYLTHIGRDAQPALRPTYGSGWVFDRNNLHISSMSTESTTQANNVRVYYAGRTAYVDYPGASVGSAYRWTVEEAPQIRSSQEALAFAKQTYERIREAPLGIQAEIVRQDDYLNLMLDGARYGYIADVSRTSLRSHDGSSTFTDKPWAWCSLHGGNLFPGMVNALDGRDGGATVQTGSSVAVSNNYFWYGANSLSYAVQVVHIPRNMPKTTETGVSSGETKGDGNLRIAVELHDTTTVPSDFSNCKFVVRLIDYKYDQRTMAATHRSDTTVIVDSNGFYEIGVPSTYWSTAAGGEKVIISVNHDYLVALVRERCGSSNQTKNAHNYTGVTCTANGTNTDSIFPLGVRAFGSADYWEGRAEWYAPRLHVTDDVNFTVGTTVSYTDSVLGLTDTPMAIRTINWSQDGRNREKVALTLERDVTRKAKTFASYIRREAPRSPSGGGSGGGGVDAVTPPGGSGRGRGGGTINDGAFPGSGAGFGGVGGAVRGSAFVPIRNANSFGNSDGTSFGSNNMATLPSSAFSAGALGRIKGTGSFPADSLTGGRLAMPGQNKPGFSPRNMDGIEGLDSTIQPLSGESLLGGEGMVFPGGVDGASTHTAMQVRGRVPSNPASTTVRVTARATMGAASGSAVLYVSVRCPETDDTSETQTVTINSLTNGSVVLFRGEVVGADVAGNTLEVTIEREPGTGSDSAQYGSVTLHNISVSVDTRSVSGGTSSSGLSY